MDGVRQERRPQREWLAALAAVRARTSGDAVARPADADYGDELRDGAPVRVLGPTDGPHVARPTMITTLPPTTMRASALAELTPSRTRDGVSLQGMARRRSRSSEAPRKRRSAFRLFPVEQEGSGDASYLGDRALGQID